MARYDAPLSNVRGGRNAADEVSDGFVVGSVEKRLSLLRAGVLQCATWRWKLIGSLTRVPVRAYCLLVEHSGARSS